MSLIYPVLAQVLLTLLIGVALGIKRVSAVRARKVRLGEIAFSDDAYPEDVRKLGNSFRNQFETPVLFYVLCGVAIYLDADGVLMTLLAWAYVAARTVHAAIHVTHNRVQQRFIPFLIGVIVLSLMWLVVAARLLVAA